MGMQEVALAQDGPRLSRIVAGLWRLADWQLDAAGLDAYMARCLDLGIHSFDHADIYGDYSCETLFGDWMARHAHLRDRIRLISKCGIKLVSGKYPGRRLNHYDSTTDHIIASAERSLAALQTDHLDLLLIHRPDPLMEADEVAEAFSALRQSGKVLHFGVSNFTPSQFDLLASRTPLVTNQVECSLLHPAPMFDGTLDQCQQRRIAPMIWSPLGGGRLFGAGLSPLLVGTLDEMTARLGVSVTTLAYAWLLRHPGRLLPIVGSRRLSALDEAVAALDLPLEREDWFTLLKAARGHDVA